MKKNNFYALLVIGCSLLFFACKKDGGEGVTLCVHSCPAGSPWTVESLDLGLPCFTTQNACKQWAVTHGYSDKPCVTCR